jgi:hypothetical protein
MNDAVHRAKSSSHYVRVLKFASRESRKAIVGHGNIGNKLRDLKFGQSSVAFRIEIDDESEEFEFPGWTCLHGEGGTVTSMKFRFHGDASHAIRFKIIPMDFRIVGKITMKDQGQSLS